MTLRVAQRLMRHSDPKLSSSVYTVLTRDDERAAIAVPPGVAAPARSDLLRAIGISSAPID